MVSLTVIVPAYNEAAAITHTMAALRPIAKRNCWEILVVNDGSTDTTADLLEGMEGIRVLTHRSNRGYGASLKSGIMAAVTPLIAFYDADGQHRPQDLEVLANRFETACCDMLVGERSTGSYRMHSRRLGKWALKTLANYLAERKIPDLNSGLRIVRRDAIIPLLRLFPNGFSFSTTSTIAFINFGLVVEYCPIKTEKRIGKSTVKQIKHGGETIILILRLILMFNPLKIFLPTSLFLFFVGAIYELVWGIILIPKVRLIPAALFTLLSSILVFFFGLVVDQISEMRKNILFLPTQQTNCLLPISSQSPETQNKSSPESVK